MRVLVLDIGGTSVKALVSGARVPRSFASGHALTPTDMVKKVQDLAQGWTWDFISIGYPGLVDHGRISAEPYNLGRGWIGFDFAAAFGCPVKLMNDAAMQALGSYQGGRMLFLGLGTGLGSSMIVDGELQPMELGHLPYRKGRTYEDYVGAAGYQRLGKKKWQKHVSKILEILSEAMEPDDIVLGGGNAHKLEPLPAGVRLGDNANAFKGGFRAWAETVK